MCDFKPGDEVEVVKVGPQSGLFISVGQMHVIREVSPTTDQSGTPLPWVDGERMGVKLAGVVAEKPNSVHKDAHFHPSLFRKVQRRDLSAWLETAATDTDRWDKPIKAPAPLHPVPSVDALFRRIMAGVGR